MIDENEKRKKKLDELHKKEHELEKRIKLLTDRKRRADNTIKKISRKCVAADRKYQNHVKIRFGVIAIDWIKKNNWNMINEDNDAILNFCDNTDKLDTLLDSWSKFLWENLPEPVNEKN